MQGNSGRSGESGVPGEPGYAGHRVSIIIIIIIILTKSMAPDHLNSAYYLNCDMQSQNPLDSQIHKQRR